MPQRRVFRIGSRIWESPDLQFDFIRVETDIKNTDTGFGVDELKVKDWNKKID